MGLDGIIPGHVIYMSCGTTHTYGEARQREGLPVKKYIHLKSFQPRHHYQKIKQSLHIVLLFGAVPWAWTLGPPVSLSQVCHPCLPPVSHGQSSLEKDQAQTLTQLSPNESLLFLKLCPWEVVCLCTQKLGGVPKPSGIFRKVRGQGEEIPVSTSLSLFPVLSTLATQDLPHLASL